MFKWLQRRPGKGEQKARLLWKREFTVVKNGLDEKQVVSFVNDLIAQYNASPDKAKPSLQTLASANEANLSDTPKSDSVTESDLEDATRLLMKQYSESLYTGEVELAIDKPVAPSLVAKLHNCLQTIPEMKLLHANGSWDRGTIITVVLDKPISLLEIISSKMPEVQALPELPQEDSHAPGRVSPLQKKGKKAARRIKLALKTA